MDATNNIKYTTKKENKNNIQINKGNNNVQNSNITKTMENFERESEYRAGKEIDRKDNYLNPQFKYRNDYNLYSMNEDNYNNVSTLQIRKDLKESKLSESILGKDRSGRDEITSTTCNNITIGLKM